MSGFYLITGWMYPLFYLIIMVLCFAVLRNSGGKLLGVAFLLDFIAAMNWRIFDLLRRNNFDGFDSTFREVISYLNPALHLVAFILIILAIFMLAVAYQSPAKVSGAGAYNGNPYQPPGAQVVSNLPMYQGQFGNVQIYLFSYIGGVVLMGFGLLAMVERELETGLGLMFLGILSVIGASIYLIVIMYRLWKYIVHESARLGLPCDVSSAGQAVGYLFIPFYNFYWGFIAYGKLTPQINAIAERYGAPELLPEELGRAIPVLVLLTLIPYLGYVVTLLLGIIFVPIFISRAIRMCQWLTSAASTPEPALNASE